MYILYCLGNLIWWIRSSMNSKTKFGLCVHDLQNNGQDAQWTPTPQSDIVGSRECMPISWCCSKDYYKNVLLKYTNLDINLQVLGNIIKLHASWTVNEKLSRHLVARLLGSLGNLLRSILLQEAVVRRSAHRQLRLNVRGCWPGLQRRVALMTTLLRERCTNRMRGEYGHGLLLADDIFSEISLVIVMQAGRVIAILLLRY